jgi:transposase-like protein
MHDSAGSDTPDRFAVCRIRFEAGESIHAISRALGIRRQSIMSAKRRAAEAGKPWTAPTTAPAPEPGAPVQGTVRGAVRAPGVTDSVTPPGVLSRQHDSFQLFSTGASIMGIARALGADRETIYRDIRAEAIRRREAFPGERDIFIQRQLQTLDTLQNQLMSRFAKRQPTANEPNPPEPPSMDPQTSAEIRKIEERRAHLLGLDAPKQVEVKQTGGAYTNAPNPLSQLSFEEKVKVMRGAIAAKARKESGMVNVTPPAAIEGETV